MATVIRTKNTRYTVEGVRIVSPKTGQPAKVGEMEILARSGSGRLHHFTRDRVGRPRFDSALAHWFATQKKEATR
jgi:hypothetical protein